MTPKKKSLPSSNLPTTVWSEREGFLKRRTNWFWRLRPYVFDKSPNCKICQFNNRCHRVPLNEHITSEILKGKECPDFKSVWKKILSDEKKYEWGF